MNETGKCAISSTDEAFAHLLHEVMRGSELTDDPAENLRLAVKKLRQERNGALRTLEQLRSMQGSRAWRLVGAARRFRRMVAPAGSRRSRTAGSIWRLLRATGVGRLARLLGESPPEIRRRKVVDPAIEALRNRCVTGQDLFIFLPSVPWNLHLFQRPQHMARHLAQAGALVVYDCSGTDEDVTGLVEREPNLFLFKGDAAQLANLPDPILWTFTYNYPQRDSYPHWCRVVYDWIDDLTVFPYDQGWLWNNHMRALAEATIVTSVARQLHEEAQESRPDAIYLPNAADFDHFARSATLPNHEKLAQLVAEGKPIAGYYGALASWFDYALVDAVAARRQDWNFLLIGPDYDGSLTGQAALRRPNVHWVGPRPYAELPGWLQAMTCAMIPFQINDITRATSPLKLYEYLAGGKPVITTAMPECLAHAEVRTIRSPGEFCAALDQARRDAADPARVEQLRDVGRSHSWQARARMVLQRFAAVRQVDHLQAPGSHAFARALWSYFEPQIGTECFPMWFEYALTTNDRGRMTAGTVARCTSLAGKDYLDVGCAYGGFLVAFAEQGAKPQGIDLDTALLELARVNLGEQGIKAALHRLDATGEEFGQRFQACQDIITCNDVIEHVADPEALVRNLAGALRPDGVLYLEIPNKDYAPYILEDGHYRLFGITLLDYEQARDYYACLFPGVFYGMGHYLRLEEYRELLARYGLHMELLEGCITNANLDTTLAAVNRLEREGPTLLNSVPEAHRDRVAVELARYLEDLRATPCTTAQERRDFMVRYGVSFWQVLARKQAG